MLAAILFAAAAPVAPPARAVAVARARIVSAPRLDLRRPGYVQGARVGKRTIDFE